MKYFRLGAAVVLALSLIVSVPPTFAQMSLDDIEASVGDLSDEMTRVDALLNSEDANKRLAAMDMLIKSGNPDYAKRAKEVGLFSSDKQMQRRALAAVFDAGGPFRVDFPLSGVDEDATRIRDYIKNAETGVLRDDDKVGQYLVYLAPFDIERQCWFHKNSDRCAITPTGDQYVFEDYNFVGSFTLSSDGTIIGQGSYSDLKTIKFLINLME